MYYKFDEEIEIVGEMTKEANITVKWTGSYPNLCSGHWTIQIDDMDLSYLVKHIGEMNTFGTYPKWHFENWTEVWDSYEDGLEFSDWEQENLDWLNQISDSPKLHKILYEEIQKSDWRHMSCGGCI